MNLFRINQILDFVIYASFASLFGLLAWLLYIPGADRRNFDDIVKQCEDMGYIQNQTIRVICSVEKSK